MAKKPKKYTVFSTRSQNSLTSPPYNESIVASFWIPYSRFTHWRYHEQCFKLQDQLFSSAQRDERFFLCVADTESVTGLQRCFGTGNVQRCQRQLRTYAVTAATAALVKTLKPVGPRDFYLTLIRFIDYTIAQRQKSFQLHTPAENPGEMWAGTLTHATAFPHSLETYQRPVTTAMEGARPTPPTVDLFISAPVSQLRPTWTNSSALLIQNYLWRGSWLLYMLVMLVGMLE